jgi:hypothetical protein
VALESMSYVTCGVVMLSTVSVRGGFLIRGTFEDRAKTDKKALLLLHSFQPDGLSTKKNGPFPRLSFNRRSRGKGHGHGAQAQTSNALHKSSTRHSHRDFSRCIHRQSVFQNPNRSCRHIIDSATARCFDEATQTNRETAAMENAPTYS